MIETTPFWKTVLLHFTEEDQTEPLRPLYNLQILGPVADLRRELERWFGEALSAPGDFYEYFENRQNAFRLRDALLNVIELAHFLERLDSHQKKELFMNSL